MASPTMTGTKEFGGKITINVGWSGVTSECTYAKVTYEFAGTTGTINSKVLRSTTSITWTIPASFASKIPNSSTGSLKIVSAKYDDDGTNWSTGTSYVTVAIPQSMYPTVDSVTLAETITAVTESGFGYLQNKSRIKATTTASAKYDATIKSYKFEINGVTYTNSTFTTGVLKTAGENSWKVTVTDSRGKTGTQSGTFDVMAYHRPKINTFTVVRCDDDGTENDEGTSLKVTVNTEIAPCNNGSEDLNTKTLTVATKTTSSDTWGREISVYKMIDESFTIDGYFTMNPFDVNTSYNIRLTQTDCFETVTKIVTVKSSESIMDFLANGRGMAIGKASELEDTLEVGWQTKLTGGLSPVFLEADTDLDDIRIPNFYTGQNISSYNYVNCPLSSGTFYLEVVSMGEDGQVRQRISSCSKGDSVTYERFYYLEEWGEWLNCYIGEEVIYYNEAGSNEEITLSESSSQFQYIEILFYYSGSYYSSVKVYSPNGKKINMVGAMVNQNTSAIYFSATNATISGNKITPNYYGEYTITGDSWAFTTNRIYITRVVGHR